MIHVMKQHPIMKLGNNYLTTLPTELALLTQLTSDESDSNVNGNYLNCADFPYLPDGYCDSAAQSSLSINQFSLQSFHKSLLFSACSLDSCDSNVCDGDCKIKCGNGMLSTGDYCSYPQQYALHMIAAQLPDGCTAPAIDLTQSTGTATGSTECGTFSISWNADGNVNALFVYQCSCDHDQIVHHTFWQRIDSCSHRDHNVH